MGGIDLEDAQLTLARGWDGGGAQRAFCVARTRFAGRDQLAGKFDQICGQWHGWPGGLFKDGGLAEGDLFIEETCFGIVAVLALSLIHI